MRLATSSPSSHASNTTGASDATLSHAGAGPSSYAHRTSRVASSRRPSSRRPGSSFAPAVAFTTRRSSVVFGPRRSIARATAASAREPIQCPDPTSSNAGPHPAVLARVRSGSARTAKATVPVPATSTTPAGSPASSSSCSWSGRFGRWDPLASAATASLSTTSRDGSRSARRPGTARRSASRHRRRSSGASHPAKHAHAARRRTSLGGESSPEEGKGAAPDSRSAREASSSKPRWRSAASAAVVTARTATSNPTLLALAEPPSPTPVATVRPPPSGSRMCAWHVVPVPPPSTPRTRGYEGTPGLAMARERTRVRADGK